MNSYPPPARDSSGSLDDSFRLFAPGTPKVFDFIAFVAVFGVIDGLSSMPGWIEFILSICVCALLCMVATRRRAARGIR